MIISNFDFIWSIAGLDKSNRVYALLVKRGIISEIAGHIEFLGRLDEETMVNNLLASDLHVMPSHIENSPNNLCEAMLIRLPCITTLASGSMSLLEDKKEGR